MILASGPQVFRHAWTLLTTGRRGEAATLVREGLIRSPDDGRFLQLQGLLWYQSGNLTGARAAFESALLATPLMPQASLALAEIYMKTRRASEARTILEGLSGRLDLDVELLPRVASLLGRLGDAHRALRLCRRVMERDPDCDEAVFGAAYYMRRLGFPPQNAAALLRQAVRLDPECGLYRRTLALLLLSMNELDEAYELLQHVDLERVDCVGCLSKIYALFTEFDDASRCRACRLRMYELDADRQQSNERSLRGPSCCTRE